MIVYNEADYTSELSKDLKFYISVDTTTRKEITDIITEFWDSFVKEGKSDRF